MYEHQCLENIFKNKNWLANMMINSSTRQLLKLQWYPFLRYLLTTFQYHLDHICLQNNLTQGNISVNFQKHWTQNQRLISSGYVFLHQRARQSEKTIFCCPLYQNYTAIQKNECVKRALYKWILQYTHVVQSLIATYCIKLSIDRQ